MSDNKNYYYLKLKDNFFDSDSMVLLETMQDGYLYSNILLKLYLKSLKNEGLLTFSDRIPYNSQMLASLTRHQVGVIEKAISVFRDLELIEVMDSGKIFIADIHNFIGKSTTEADRKREYRSRIDSVKSFELGHLSEECPDKYPPEIRDKSLEIELELKKDNTIVEKSTSKTASKTVFTDEFLSLWETYLRKGAKTKAFKAWEKLKAEDKSKALYIITNLPLIRERQFLKDLERFLANPDTFESLEAEITHFKQSNKVNGYKNGYGQGFSNKTQQTQKEYAEYTPPRFDPSEEDDDNIEF